MNWLQFAIVVALGLIGLVSVCVAIVCVGLEFLDQEIANARFRRELREAAQAEADYRKVDRSLKAHGRRRHSQAVCPFPARRGGER